MTIVTVTCSSLNILCAAFLMMCWVIEAIHIDPSVEGYGLHLYAHEIPLIGSEGIQPGVSLNGTRKWRSRKAIDETVDENQISKGSV